MSFIPGLSAKRPHQNAPDFVKAKISIKVADLGNFLREKHKAGEEWVNADLKVSKEGNLYIAEDEWKPERQPEPAGGNDYDDDIPF